MKKYIFSLLLLCSIGFANAAEKTFTTSNFSTMAFDDALKNYDVIKFESGTFSFSSTPYKIIPDKNYKRDVTISGVGDGTVLSGLSLKIEGQYTYEIKNVTIRDYTSDSDYGAITIKNGCKLTLEHVTFRTCKAKYGGAVSIIGTSAKITNCFFAQNESTEMGSAVYCCAGDQDANVLIEKTMIASNAISKLGAVAIDGTTANKKIGLSIVNSTIAFNSNESTTNRRGVYAKGSKNGDTSLSVIYSTIAYNDTKINERKVGNEINGIYFEPETATIGKVAFNLTNSVVSLNQTGPEYSDASDVANKDINLADANVTTINHSFIGTGDAIPDGKNDNSQTGIYNDLLKLSANLETIGGYQKSFLVGSGSSLIDAGTVVDLSAIDPVSNVGIDPEPGVVIVPDYAVLDLFYDEADVAKTTPIGVVVYVDEDGGGLAVSLDEGRNIYASDGTGLGFNMSTTREAAMAKIKDINKMAQYFPYAFAANKGNNWYLPTVNDYKKIYEAWNGSSSTTPNETARAAFNAILTGAGGTAITAGTSNESDNTSDAYFTCNVENGIASFYFGTGVHQGWGARDFTRNYRAIRVF